ncbi:putative ankyrin repeat protein RBE_0489 isoform X3 [Mercenaria mercenaria]|uniref:putative ankyrin repeat protein RBE_0489 isoform X3 n=1 Tax=Mercenaria mercenaria TaxID=6596 RepID=UPI00234F8C79|nr:putative ankyrin repeat protein RBE_0489 isoform X3 [Mercenaria mercenaria]
MALFDLLASTRSLEQKLIDAVSSNNIEQLQKLLEEGVDPNKKLHKFGGDRAIHIAATKGNTSAIEHLINAGADYELPNDLGITPLYNAVRANHPLAVKELLKHYFYEKSF